MIFDFLQLFINGFSEVELSNDIMESENYIPVKSNYKKTFTKDSVLISEKGTNMITLVKVNGELKNSSIPW